MRIAAAGVLRLGSLSVHAGSVTKGCLCPCVTGLLACTALAQKQKWGQQVSVPPALSHRRAPAVRLPGPNHVCSPVACFVQVISSAQMGQVLRLAEKYGASATDQAIAQVRPCASQELIGKTDSVFRTSRPCCVAALGV